MRKNREMESNMSPNMSPKQNGHLVSARKLLILKVGTAGFEPTASCTPKKCATFSGLFLIFLS